ncbi:hypothetical protein V2J09_019752 [Rumex salicifolius]
MAANFNRWENDPFFSAAEEVQESADRMDSIYRTWFNSMKGTSTELNREDLRRDLCTASDTAKWQLEEFERAVQNSYNDSNADEAKHRHRQFVLAIEGKVSMIQNSLQESAASNGNLLSPWIQLNEGECDELALFIYGPQSSLSSDKTETQIRSINENAVNSQAVDGPLTTNCLRCNCLPSVQTKDGNLFGLRRTASADIASWNIAIPEHELASHSSNGLIEVVPRRVPSFSAFGTMESVLNNKLPKSSSRKWKPEDDDVTFLRSQNRGVISCYERNKSCIENCDDCYDKQLYGWYGSLRRLVQRALYQVQYVRSKQITFGATLLLCMMGEHKDKYLNI